MTASKPQASRDTPGGKSADPDRKSVAGMPPYVVAIIVLTVAQAVGAIGHLTLPVVASRAALDLGLSPSLIGIYTAIVFAGSAASTLLLAGAVPRIGVIRVTQMSLATLAAGLALLAVAEPWLLPLSALLIGLGYGAMAPGSSLLLARLVPAHRMALLFSIKQTGVPIGYGIAGLMLPAIVLVADWQTAVLAACALPIAIGLLLDPLRRIFDADRSEGEAFRLSRLANPLALVARTPGLRRMAICSLSFSAIQMGVASFLVVYLDTSVGMSLAEAGSILTIANVVAVGSRISWGWIGDRFAARWVFGTLAVGMAVGMMGIVLITDAWPYAAVAAVGAVIGLTAIAWNGVFLAETTRQAPAGKVSEAVGGVMFVTFSGAVIGPPALTALVALSGSYTAGFVILAGLAIAMAAMFVFGAKPGQSPGGSSA